MLRLLVGICDLSTLFLCLILKLPQIINVFEARSGNGISQSSLLLELWGYATVLTYSISNNFAFMSYGEYAFLIVQDIFLILLVLHYTKGYQVLWIYFILGIFQFMMAAGFCPSWFMALMMMLCTPISASSKVIQLKVILAEKTAGQVSALSWSLSAYTSAARIFTTVVESGDIPILLNLLVSLVLNIAIVSAAVYYGKTEKKLKI